MGTVLLCLVCVPGTIPWQFVSANVFGLHFEECLIVHLRNASNSAWMCVNSKFTSIIGCDEGAH